MDTSPSALRRSPGLRQSGSVGAPDSTRTAAAPKPIRARSAGSWEHLPVHGRATTAFARHAASATRLHFRKSIVEEINGPGAVRGVAQTRTCAGRLDGISLLRPAGLGLAAAKSTVGLEGERSALALTAATSVESGKDQVESPRLQHRCDLAVLLSHFDAMAGSRQTLLGTWDRIAAVVLRPAGA